MRFAAHLLSQFALCLCAYQGCCAAQADPARRADTASVIARAQQLVAQRHSSEADALLSAALAVQPNQAGLLVALGELRLQQKNFTGAQPLLRRALGVRPDDVRIVLDLGHLLLATRQLAESMEYFEIALAREPLNEQARAGELASSTSLALSMRSDNHPDAALEILQHARKFLPDEPTLLSDLGVLADATGRYLLADEALKTSLRLRPGDLTTIYALARVELDQQHLADAEQHLRTYLAARPEDPTAYYGLGRVLAMEIRTSEAREAFKRSITLQPVQSESYYELGVIAADAGEDADAEPLFRKVLQRAPKHGGALTGLGRIAYRARAYPAARGLLSDAVSASPEYQPAHYYLGLTLARLGEKQASDQELMRAKELAEKQQSKASPIDAGPLN